MHFQRRFNFTGRRRLNKSDVVIQIVRVGNTSPKFNATIDFSNLTLPADAPVIIEARQRDLVQRYHCGTVATFAVPANAALDELDPESPMSFWVRVVDSSRPDKRLIAVARSIRPVGDDDDGVGKDSLLSLKSKDLGQIPWMIEYPESEDGIPKLVVNNRIPEAMERLSSDPVFQALVFPAAIRDILSRILIEEDERGDEESWQAKWIDHGASLAGEPCPEYGVATSHAAWVQDAARGFCERFAIADRMLNTDKDG